MILILLLIKREQNWMKRYLAPEIDRGVIDPDRYHIACSAWRQSSAFAEALVKGNLRQVRRYYQVCGDLMHKLRLPSNQKIKGDAQQEIANLRRELGSLAEGPQMHPQYLEFQNLTAPIFDKMMLGEITPQEMIDEACEQIEARLK